MKLYRTKNWSFSIDTVDSERQTDKSVFIDGGRNNWSSDYCSYFKTYIEAKEHLLSIAQQAVNSASNRLEYANRDLNKANQL